MHCRTLFALGILYSLIATTVQAEPVQISLPKETATLRESSLPGYALAQQKCSICHSLDYISFQPPNMNLEQWTAEMQKMQHSYGAPIDDHEIRSIAAYLAVSYGSAQATDQNVIAASTPPPKAETPTDVSIDVDKLLSANACLGCHAVDTKIVGPSFRDVATKYAGQKNAQDNLAASIRSGGSGKWGEIPMPPMAGLTDAEAKALAVHILAQ